MNFNTLSSLQVNQIHGTYKRGGTGQLSKSSIFLLNMRSVGRLLTSLFDTCDNVLVLCYAHACFWNTLITCQTVFYGHRRRRRLREERKRQERERLAYVGATSESSSDSDNTDSEIGLEQIRRRRRYNALAMSNGTQGV